MMPQEPALHHSLRPKLTKRSTSSSFLARVNGAGFRVRPSHFSSRPVGIQAGIKFRHELGDFVDNARIDVDREPARE